MSSRLFFFCCLLVVCSRTLPSCAQYAGECQSTCRWPVWLTTQNYDSSPPHISRNYNNPSYWYPEDFEERTPRSIELRCLTCIGDCNLLYWHLVAFYDDQFGEEEPFLLRNVMRINVARRQANGDPYPNPFWFEQYPLIEHGSSHPTATRYYHITWAEALRQGVPFRTVADPAVEGLIELPANWEDGTFADEFKQWVISSSYDHPSGIIIPDLGCVWANVGANNCNSSYVRPDADGLIGLLHTDVMAIPNGEYAGMPCGLHVQDYDIPRDFWTYHKGSNEAADELTDPGFLEYLVGESSLAELLGLVEPGELDEVGLNSTFKVPLPRLPFFAVALQDGWNIIGSSPSVQSTGTATLVSRGLVRLFVMLVWTWFFIRGVIRQTTKVPAQKGGDDDR